MINIRYIEYLIKRASIIDPARGEVLTPFAQHITTSELFILAPNGEVFRAI